MRFYELMIAYALHDSKYLDVCKYYRQIADSKSIKEDDGKTVQVLRDIVLSITLSAYDNEQADLIARVSEDVNLEKAPLYKELLKCFTTPELMRWSKMEEIYGQELKNPTPIPHSNKTVDVEMDQDVAPGAAVKKPPTLSDSFARYAFDLKTEDGMKRWKELHKRINEHNLRVLAKYYTRITMKRLTSLLDMDRQDAEDLLSRLVVDKTVAAKIDRPAGIVTFKSQVDSPKVILNQWSANVNSVLDLIAKVRFILHQLTR
jgi:26S proteasome regulatory subunit N5